MKLLRLLIIGIITVSCSTTKLQNSWRNSDYDIFSPKKILIVGLTDNLTGRSMFEERLSQEFNKRGINANEGIRVFTTDFTNLKQSEMDIEKKVRELKKDNYDSILVTSVIGIDERVSYSDPYYSYRPYYLRFGRYYYLYQDIYYERGYYDQYKIYHLESALYDISSGEEKALVWVASYDLVDPGSLRVTIEDYVKRIVNTLEKENIIPKH